MMKHIIFISLLFSISLQALEHPSENNWSSASQAGDQLNRFETELEQALKKIASLENENDYWAEKLMATAGEKRELEQALTTAERESNKLKIERKFYRILLPLSFIAGPLIPVMFNNAKGIHQADSKVIAAISKIITNPQLSLGLAQKHPSLYYSYNQTFFNDAISIQICPLEMLSTAFVSTYNNHYYRMRSDEGYAAQTARDIRMQGLTALKIAAADKDNEHIISLEQSLTERCKNEKLSATIAQNRLTPSEAAQLTTCELLEKLIRGINIHVTEDPIAKLPGIKTTIITTEQLFHCSLEAISGEAKRFVIYRIQNKEYTSNFTQNFTQHVGIEVIYNLIAQSVHHVTTDKDGNPNPTVEIIFPTDLQQLKTPIQSLTKDGIEWLLINGTPYLWQKISEQSNKT